ncbi:hypothetical protein [Candidatus Palauibacter sp.]|uniref:hypothetical protein n=1 Tax=Candidatus Palauibacter sp. TaxID=3101350 RepID=UPI003B018D78
MIRRRERLAVAIPVIAGGLAFGCGGGADSPDPAADPAAAAREADEAAADSIYAIDAVDVALLEYAIGMPTRLPPGPTVLRLSNQGFEGHNLKLVDPASREVLWETEEDVNTGETRLVELVLEPGTWTMLCDVAGHDTRGMLMTLTVATATGS